MTITKMSLFLLLLFSLTTFHKSMSCNEKDKETLLTFKKGIIDPIGWTRNWSTKKDCCSWNGVGCDNTISRVIELDLNYKLLKGEINLCILELEFLTYLDLSWNYFDMISIPSIQPNITHETKLLYLDLSPDFTVTTFQMDNLYWLSPLSSLEYLNLNEIDLHKENNWLQTISTLPSLLELHLKNCKLNSFMINPSVEYLNLSSLITLDLSENNFTSHLPNAFFNLTKDIKCLDLRKSNIQGEIPSSLLNLRNLRRLDLSNNQLLGSIPNGIGQLSHIQYLDLSMNVLSGFIPSTLENHSSLYYLSMAYNHFSGEISETTFSKLSSLKSLDLRSLNLVFQFDSDWSPPFQLKKLLLCNTNQGSTFPSWIYTQKSLEVLDLSSSGISLVDRNKFSSLIERINDTLLLSNNSMTEDLSNLTLKSRIFDLDHNNFTGGLPNISPMAFEVDFSYNSFSGSIPHSWKKLKKLSYINLWNNKLSGEVLVHLSNWTQLEVMILGKNEFYGTMPINMSKMLKIVILRSNHFEGTIPTYLFNLTYLFHLDLAQNKFSGSISNCVYNLTYLISSKEIDWHGGTIELFIKGHEYPSEIRMKRGTLDLSSNSLSGEIPLDLFRLVQVQTLNLSHNSFDGPIASMIRVMENLESLDFSNNKLGGEIPQSMTLLHFLGYLNLSCNNFNGKIPSGTQLQSFNASSYIGNPNLCGAPLNNCSAEQESPSNEMSSRWNEDGDSIRESLYLGMGVGFAVGFWAIFGSLLYFRKWRHIYYRFVDEVGDKLYVNFMVMLNNFRRN